MLRSDRDARFELNEQYFFNEQVCCVVSQLRSVFIEDTDWELLLYFNADLA